MNEKLKLKFLHSLFPNKCPCCRKTIRYDLLFCSECKAEFERASGTRCKTCFRLKELCDCKSNPKFFFRSASPFVYKNAVTKAIISLKRRKNKRLARFFADEMYETIKKRYKDTQFDAIIPVPLHKSREKQRGFNQSTLLSFELSEKLHIPVLKNVLIQTQKAQSQHTLRYKQRKENVKGIYKAGHIPIEYQRILLVDDIMTSGATLNECAKMLRLEGVTKIYCITIAKTD